MAVLAPHAAHRDVQIGIVLAFMLGLGVLFITFRMSRSRGVAEQSPKLKPSENPKKTTLDKSRGRTRRRQSTVGGQDGIY